MLFELGVAAGEMLFVQMSSIGKNANALRSRDNDDTLMQRPLRRFVKWIGPSRSRLGVTSRR